MIAIIFLLVAGMVVSVLAIGIVRSGAEDDKRQRRRKLSVQEMEALGDYLLNPETFNEPLRENRTKPYKGWRCACCLLCFPVGKGTWRAATRDEFINYDLGGFYLFEKPSYINGELRVRKDGKYYFQPYMPEAQDFETGEILVEEFVPETYIPAFRLCAAEMPEVEKEKAEEKPEEKPEA